MYDVQCTLYNIQCCDDRVSIPSRPCKSKSTAASFQTFQNIYLILIKRDPHLKEILIINTSTH